MLLKMQATCHPDRKHKAFGLCPQCYRKRPDQRQKAAERLREWRERNPDRVNAQATDNRRRWLLQAYGITLEAYTEMLVSQFGRCAICGDGPTRQNLNVDHCHETGKVRGLLCDPCNTALERVEIQGWVSAALTYLR